MFWSRSASNISREFALLLPSLRQSDDEIYYIERRRRRLGIILSPTLVEVVLSHGKDFFDKGSNTQFWRSVIGDGTGIRPPLKLGRGEVVGSRDLVTWRKFRRRSLAYYFSRSRFPTYRLKVGNEIGDMFSEWAKDPERELIGDARQMALNHFVGCFGDESVRPPLQSASDVVFRSRSAAKAAVDRSWLCPFDRGVGATQRLWQITQPLLLRELIVVRERARVMSAVFEDVAARSRGSDTDCLFTALSRTAHEYDSDIPRRMLPGQMQGLFIAGTETISSALVWLLFHLIRDVELQERLAYNAEADQLLRSCIYESLRLHPPAWSIPRESLVRIRLGGELIDRGTVFVASPLIQHYQDRSYPDPRTFDPERFLDAPKPSGTYYPFSLGPRTCPAMAFTLDHVEAVVGQVVRSWRLQAMPEQGDLHHWLGLDLGVDPRQHFRFRAFPR